MFIASSILKDILFFKMQHEKDDLNIGDQDPAEFLEDALELFEKDANAIFKEQTKSIGKSINASKKETKKLLSKEIIPWQGVFDAMRTIHFINLDLAQTVDEIIMVTSEDNAEFDDSHLHHLSYYIHKRACQTFYEIIILLENGLVEGAFTLWHTMHELCCCLLFIQSSKTPEKLAEAYIRYSHDDDGRNLWAKTDKRVASSRGSFIPFHRIESMCNLEIIFPEMIFSFRHIQARGSEFMLHSKDTPIVYTGIGVFDAALPAISAIKTLQVITENLVLMGTDADVLIQLYTLELWNEKLEEMIINVEETYAAQTNIKTDMRGAPQNLDMCVRV